MEGLTALTDLPCSLWCASIHQSWVYLVEHQARRGGEGEVTTDTSQSLQPWAAVLLGLQDPYIVRVLPSSASVESPNAYLVSCASGS